MGITWMQFVEMLEAGYSAGVVQQVEVFKGFPDQRIEVERIGMCRSCSRS